MLGNSRSHYANRRRLPPSAPLPKTHPNHKFLSLLLQALIMAFVISLFFIFVGVAAVIFFHLCIASGALQGRRRRPRGLPNLVECPSGYSLEVLNALPKMKFKAGIESNSMELCAICLDSVMEGDWCRVLPSCKHLFHLNCVDRWLLKVPACPVCRSSVRLNTEGKDTMMGGGDFRLLWPAACG